MKKVMSILMVFMLVVGTLCSSMVYAGAAEISTGKEMGSEAVGAANGSKSVGAAINTKAPTITRVVNLRTDQRVCFKTNGSKSNCYILYRREKTQNSTGKWFSKPVYLYLSNSNVVYDSKTGEYGIKVLDARENVDGEIFSGVYYQYQLKPVGDNKCYSNVSGMTWLKPPIIRKAVQTGNELRVNWGMLSIDSYWGPESSYDYSGELCYELWCSVDGKKAVKVADVKNADITFGDYIFDRGHSFTGNLKKGTHKYSYQVRSYRKNIGYGKPYSAFSKVYSVTATA